MDLFCNIGTRSYMETIYSSSEKLKYLHILISLVIANGDITNKDRQYIYTLGLHHGLSFTEIDMLVYHPLNLSHYKFLNASEKQNLLAKVVKAMPTRHDQKVMQETESLCMLMAERLGIHQNEALTTLQNCNDPLEEIHHDMD